MPGFRFWRDWLLAVCAIVIVFGVSIALLSRTPAFAAFNALVDGTFWAGSAPDDGVRAFQLWAYGMLGATMAGWGVFMAYTVMGPFSKREKWSWDCIAAGIGVWFAIDTAVSAYVMAGFNVAINVLILALVALPLAMTRKELVEKSG